MQRQHICNTRQALCDSWGDVAVAATISFSEKMRCDADDMANLEPSN